MAFERVDVSGPEAAERGEPGIDLLERLRAQAIETALGVDGRFNETGFAQDAQVPGNGGLRQAEAALDLTHRLLGRDEQIQDGAAVRLGDDFEHRLHSCYIRHCAYTCQDI